MSTFVLIPGASGVAWYWHRIVTMLQRAGHEPIAVDLPGDDEVAGLPEYTRRVVDAIGDRDDVVLVAQSLGGPGNVCTANSCVDEWSPWPWLAVGLVLVVLGFALFVRIIHRRIR